MNPVMSARVAAPQLLQQSAAFNTFSRSVPSSSAQLSEFSRLPCTSTSYQRQRQHVPVCASLRTSPQSSRSLFEQGKQVLRSWQQKAPRKAALAVVGLVGGVATPVLAGGGGGFGSGSSSVGGGGGGDGFHWDRGSAQAAAAEEEEEEEEDDEEEDEEEEEGEEEELAPSMPIVTGDDKGEEGEDMVADIAAFDEHNMVRAWPPHKTSPYQVSGEPLGVEQLREKYVGKPYSADLLDKLERDFVLWYGEYIEAISFSLERNTKDASLKDNEVRLIVNWREPVLPPIRGLRVEGTSLITEDMKREILRDLQEEKPLNARTLAMFKDRLKASFKTAGLEAGLYQMNILHGNVLQLSFYENRIGKVNFTFMDDEGGVQYNDEIAKSLPVGYREGDIMKTWKGLGPLQEGILAMGAFNRVGIGMRPNRGQGEKAHVLDLNIQCELANHKGVDGELEWQFIPNEAGKPTLYSLEPGGTIMYQQSNFGGWNKSFSASIGTSNFFSPMEDIGFIINYRHLNIFGVNDPKKRRLEVSAFNNRKESATHSPSPAVEGVPSIMIDRAGVKATLTEFPFFSSKTKISYGATLEEINTKGDDWQFAAQGSKILSNGTYDDQGPPTCLGMTGSDKQFFLQGRISYDDLKVEREVKEGTRALFTMEQGTWLGTEHPFFNRFTASGTRYFRFDDLPCPDSVASPSAVVHAKIGNTLGDLAPYDAQPLGGPYTVRSYGIGDIGTARRFLELATEVRYPIKGFSTYGYLEYATGLGSGPGVPGNPDEYYGRPGSGYSYGGGLEWCGTKFEYQRDCHKKRGAWVLRYGNRF